MFGAAPNSAFKIGPNLRRAFRGARHLAPIAQPRILYITKVNPPLKIPLNRCSTSVHLKVRNRSDTTNYKNDNNDNRQ